jgi:hypothetical protein
VFWDNSCSARVFGSTFKDIQEFPWFSESASFHQEADFFSTGKPTVPIAPKSYGRIAPGTA